MTFAKIFLISIFLIYFIIIIYAYIKTKTFFSTFIIIALQGICALFAVNLLGQYISVHIPLNGLTIGISSLGGIPGIIMILLCDVFMY